MVVENNKIRFRENWLQLRLLMTLNGIYYNRLLGGYQWIKHGKQTSNNASIATLPCHTFLPTDSLVTASQHLWHRYGNHIVLFILI